MMSDSRLTRRIQSVEDARLLARRHLPRFLYDRYEAGAGDGITLRENVKAFEAVTFRQRAGRFAATRSLGYDAFGIQLEMPVMLAPVGVLGAGRTAAEASAAAAAVAAGVVSILSSATGTAVEDVSKRCPGRLFYQLYYLGGRAGAEAMIERARAAGCRALVVTMDTQARGERDRTYVDRAYAPESLAIRHLLRAAPDIARHPGWLAEFLRRPARSGRGLSLPMARGLEGDRDLPIFEMGRHLYRLTPTWEDFDWIRAAWQGPIVAKGVLNADDARCAIDAGADAVVVSNHGGNGLDGRPATLRALPGVVNAVDGRIPVWMDGGIRRGSDVVKALALGANAVLIGRAYLYALMAAGEPGVRRILEIFRDDIDRTLAFLGCESVDELDDSFVDLPREWRD
jgi:isopentenyl diphosphate isomerase/L-lactate dehydrogenase-like FMN-dependent dehydrogenase